MARSHGHRATYLWGCRCSWCTEASRDYQRRYRKGIRVKPSGFTSRVGDKHVPRDHGEPLSTWTRVELMAIREAM